MAGVGLDRGSSYRRRLARAAVASLALHVLLFGSLSVSRLDLATDRPDEAEARAPKKPQRAADFRLQVSRSRPAERPAHERPLALEVAAAAALPTESRERPHERSVTERRLAAAEPEHTPAPTEPRFERSRSETVPDRQRERAAIERLAEATPSAPAAAADMPAAATAAATEAAAASAPAPVAARPRERVDAGAVAARWRPREVALLERLTTRAPDATALTARPEATAPPAARAEAMSRKMPAAAPGEAAARAASIAVAAAQTSPPPPAAVPAARDLARRAAPATAATSRPEPAAAQQTAALAAEVAAGSPSVASVTRVQLPTGSSALPPTARRAPARESTAVSGAAMSAASSPAPGGGPAAVAVTSGGGTLAPAAIAGGRAGRQAARGSTGLSGGPPGSADGDSPDSEGGGAVAGLADRLAERGAADDLGGGLRASRESLPGSGAGMASRSRSPGRDTASLGAGDADTGSIAAEALPGTGAADAGGGSGAAAAVAGHTGGGRAGSLTPAMIDRGGRRPRGRAAVATSPGSGTTAEAAAEGEGLSISAADLAALTAARREQGGLPTPAAGSRSPERIAAAALPTDGRVRDVAEAFAGRNLAARSGGEGEPAGGIADRAALERARVLVDRGLEFLVRSQQADGRWRLTEFAGVTPADVPQLDSDTAATGLALLSFLGAGHDHFSGPHCDTVRRGLEFLLSVQKEDGDLFLPADELSNSCSWLYSHGIAAIALSEAVGMTGDPLLRPAAEKACRFIATSQHPTLGGWRYLPRAGADLSVSGWMLVALRAGDLAGVTTDPAALGGVRTLLTASSSPSDPTRFAYNARKADQRRTDLSVACMTAVGTLMRLHTGTAADDPGVVASARVLIGFPPVYGTQSQRVRDSYLWYYASQVLVHTGGDDWQAWYASLVDTLERPQRRDGPLGGSWDAMGDVPDRWGEYGGRLYVTTLHLLALEVPWRHLPSLTPSGSK
jgi:hypothetical protein